ncbi:hypothetical protein [Thalassospira australica]|uniref:hypothetical protein n=1 Tax=Thalassospira australica TaxID=1528106 RepID=UPI00385062D6
MSNPREYKWSDEDIIAYGELCQWVGMCLSVFSRIEESLAVLFGTAAGIPLIETAFRTHDEIREFHYRLDATNSVVRLWISSLPQHQSRNTLESEWNALCRIIKEDSQDRNRLAHFRIAPNDNKDGSTTYFVCPYFQIFSHVTALQAMKGKAKIPNGVRKFDVKSLEAKLNRFESTAKRIDRFIGGLTEHGAQLPKLS